MSTTLGTGRSDARTAHRGARRPSSILNPGPAQSGRVPHRQDLRRLGRTVSSIPAPTQRALRTLEWLHRHENLVVCGPSGTGKTHFLEALGQSRRRCRPQGVLVQSRAPRRARAPPRRRRHRRQSHPADHARRRHRDRRHRPTAGRHRDRRGALPRVDAAYEKRSIARRAFTRPGSTNSCPRPSPTPPSTGSCTTPTSS